MPRPSTVKSLVATALFSACALASTSALADSWEHDSRFEVGYQGSMLLSDGKVTRTRLYGGAEHKTSLFGDTSPTRWKFAGHVRGWVDLDSEVDLRNLSIERADDITAITLGFQEIAWGETFGFPIADIVNPRDLRDPFFAQMDWIRRANFTLNAQLLLESFRLQGLVTPVPRNNILPARGSAFDPFPSALDGVRMLPQRSFPIDRWGRDAEAGARAGYLFDFGLDVSALYLLHWNRTPVVELAFQGAEPVLVPVQERIHSAGLTFSYAFESWVVRGDAMVHFEEPWIASDLGPADHITHAQTVLGADMNTDSDWTLGAQGHFDQRGEENLFWGSAQLKKGLFDGRLEPQVFVFIGIDNTDRWIQPRIDWNVIDPWTVSLRADFVWGSVNDRPGDLAFYSERHRAMLWTSLRF